MPVLENPRHERFAQELAKGCSQVEAYENAGYQPNRSAASRLADDVNICARVRELAAEVQEETKVTAADLTKRLLDLAKKGENGEGAASWNVARASLMDVAKLNGLIIDKAEINASVSNMTPEQRRARIAELEARRKGER